MAEYGDPIVTTGGGTYTQVPDWLMERTELPALAKLLYSRIERYQMKSGPPIEFTREDLARECGVTVRGIFDVIDRLHVLGLIRVVSVGRTKPHVYQRLHHPWRCGALGCSHVDRESDNDADTRCEKSSGQVFPDRQDLPVKGAEGSSGQTDRYLLKEKQGSRETLETASSQLHAMKNLPITRLVEQQIEQQNAQHEERLMNAFRDLWSEHIGAKAARDLTVSQMREAVDGWDRCIELGRGELIVEAVKKAATDAETNRWRYFRGVLKGMLADAQRERGSGERGVGSGVVYDEERYREWQRRRDAGEQLAGGVLALLAEWETTR